MAADTWEDIISLVTGTTLPKSADVAAIKGDGAAPWLNVKIKKVRPVLDPPQLLTPGVGGVLHFFSYDKGYASMWEAQVTYSPQLNRDYTAKSGDALNRMLHDHKSDDSSQGIDLRSFTSVAKAFDAAGRLFMGATLLTSSWYDRMGAENAAWKGTAANVFRGMLDDLRKRYEYYYHELMPTHFKSANTSVSTGYQAFTFHGDEVIAAENRLYETYQELADQFGKFYWRGGRTISGTNADGSSTDMNPPADPASVLDELMWDMAWWIQSYNSKRVLKKTRVTDGAESWLPMSGFNAWSHWGHLKDQSTWAAMAQEAVNRWTSNIKTNLDIPGSDIVHDKLNDGWTQALNPAWNTLFGFSDLPLANLDSEYQKEKAEKQQEDAQHQAEEQEQTAQQESEQQQQAMQDWMHHQTAGSESVPDVGSSSVSTVGGGDIPAITSLPTSSSPDLTSATQTPSGNVDIAGGVPSDLTSSPTSALSAAGPADGAGSPALDADGLAQALGLPAAGATTSAYPDAVSSLLSPAALAAGAAGADAGTSVTGLPSVGADSVVEPGAGTSLAGLPSVLTGPASTAGKPVKTNADGSTVLADPDGGLTTQYPDGSSVTVAPDGTVTTTAADGTSTTSTLQPGQEITTPSGTTLGLDPDGGVTTHLTDGSSITSLPDGTVTTTNPDGSHTTQYPNGLVQTVGADGASSLTAPDGSVTTQNPDGSVTTTYPAGGSTTVVPDTGAVTTLTPDGQSISTHLDPGQSVVNPDGSTTGLGSDGSVTTTLPDGGSYTLHPDGTLTTTNGPAGAGTSHTDTQTQIPDPGTPSVTGLPTVSSGLGDSHTLTTRSPDGSTTVHFPSGSVATTGADGLTTTTFPDGSSTVTGPQGQFQALPSSDNAAPANGTASAGEGSGGIDAAAAQAAGSAGTGVDSGLSGMLSPMMMMAGMGRMGQGQQNDGQERVRDVYGDDESDGAFFPSHQAGRLAAQQDPDAYEEEEEDSEEILSRPRRDQYGPDGYARPVTQSAQSGRPADGGDVWGTDEGGLPASIGR
ncbi:AAWKG family protein [Streptomyces seoulensis]